ncbi:DUF4186 family protein [Candidatus Nitrososphaera evergladensis]|nr:DUF4186 family protein [Candidatus Nitrososphaera evergladensis]
MLRMEAFRLGYWERDIERKIVESAKKKGLGMLRQEAENRLRKYVNKCSNENPWDGRQTPLEGNIIYYSQHATATCCRKCIEAWHGINRNHPLSDEEIQYLVGLMMYYVEKKLPALAVEASDDINAKEKDKK